MKREISTTNARGHEVRSWSLGLAVLSVCVWLVLPGCIGSRPSNPALTQPATVIDKKLAEPRYWYGQPASVTVSYNDFNVLWETCERLSRDWFFNIEIRDFREGILATEPTISKQMWELWRKDAGGFGDTREATIASIRRTIRFQFTRESGGGYSVAPKVLVERRAMLDVKDRTDSVTLESSAYWYALRRDTKMELKLAESIRERLRKASPAIAEKPAQTP